LRLSQALADVAKSSAEALVGGEPGEPSMLSMVSLRLLVLHQLVARGSGDTAWVTMLDPKTQGVLAVGGPRSGIALPPVDDPVLLLQQACNSAQITDFLSATCYSFNVLELDNRTAPAKPQPSTLNAQPSSTKARPPARAGQWYPADPRQLAQVVESCIAFPRAQENWPAVMVPHAGLRFSGRLAGETFCRVRLPRNLIVFGPNHTGQGQPWAVMPDDAWLIPGASVASSTELATALTRAVPGLELDGLAHEKEHSIEIQLPLVCALSPQSAVVGITVKGSTSYEDCRRFARGMAAMIRGLAEKPLLVISTDLHHFAAEPENRRLDQMALDAVQSLDPRRLYETCRQNRISMCGLLPAVIVMETLKELGQLNRADLVGYCNSASSTGDTSRVVGYGGMLLG
jgi:AmmeMemoRadiSam system protein B